MDGDDGSQQLPIIRRQLAVAADVPQAICAAALSLLPVDGAAVLLMADAGHWHTAAATDAVLVTLEDLQLTTGDGPSVEAYVEGGPVLLPDVHAAAGRWSTLAAGLPRSICALFCLPLQIGAVRFGVLDLYRREPGPLGPKAMALALRLADLGAAALVHQPEAALRPGAADLPMDIVGASPEVDQATGVLSVQLSVSLGVAHARLRADAFARGLPLTDVANGVVTGVIRLEQADGSDA